MAVKEIGASRKVKARAGALGGAATLKSRGPEFFAAISKMRTRFAGGRPKGSGKKKQK